MHLLSFTILTMFFMKCVVLYHTSVLCIYHLTCFVRNDEIKMFNQSVNILSVCEKTVYSDMFSTDSRGFEVTNDKSKNILLLCSLQVGF